MSRDVAIQQDMFSLLFVRLFVGGGCRSLYHIIIIIVFLHLALCLRSTRSTEGTSFQIHSHRSVSTFRIFSFHSCRSV